MKAVIALTASIAVANAALMPRQSITDIPQCALSCALTSLGSAGCPSTDFSCICKATKFIEGLVPCVQGACSAADYEKTITAAEGLCSQAGVSLSVPAGAASTSAAASSAATSAAATTAPTTEATSVTSASSAATSAATVSSAATSAAVTSAAQSSTAATTTGAPTKAGGNSTVSSTSPPKPSGTEPSAAHRNTIALGGLGAIIALVAAFL